MNARTRRAGFVRITVLWIAGAVFLFPLFWMISTSLKPTDQIMSAPPIWLPSPIRWRNYLEAIRAFPFVRYFLNSTVLAGLKVTGTLFTAAMAGYAFAKLSWCGRDRAFYVTVATMFIPDELLESARIDGAPEMVIFLRIVAPMCVPVFVTLGMFTFIFSWNDFIGPLLYVLDTDKWVLPLGLRAFQQQYSTQWNLLMAASTLTSLPLVLLYFYQQEKLSRGFSVQVGIK